ncbi:FtsK/SpoIIIE domain-containing protein [Limnoglobus roseus]|uniref:Cell division protein FtsK n=1 Tax=Limnoglobus roseus TaxID=2598579 RepID=A0A5C1A9N6_9BACT|nr:FtsK/SpoIIIE domain-containing protein [Limnoglobus roseus]QEL14937.1 cell division protein FtsK [Limnoglobus roseus]
MSDALFDRERASLAKLLTLIRDRAKGETEIATTYQTAADETEKDIQKVRRQIAAGRKTARDATDDSYQKQLADMGAKYLGRQNAADSNRAEALRKIEEKFQDNDQKTRAKYQDRLWTIDSLIEAAEKEANDHHQKLVRQAEGARKKFAEVWKKVQPSLQRVGLQQADVEYPADRLPSPTPTDPEGKLQSCVEDVEAAAGRVTSASLPKFIRTPSVIGLAIVAGGIGFGIGMGVGTIKTAAIIAGVTAVLGGVGLYFLFLILAKRQVRTRAVQLGVFQAEASRAADSLQEYAKTTHAKQIADLKRRQATDRKKADDYFVPLLAKIAGERTNNTNRVETEYNDRLDSIGQDRFAESKSTDDRYASALAAVDAKFDKQLREAEDGYAAKMATATATRGQTWNAMSNTWHTGVADVGATLDDLKSKGQKLFPKWEHYLEGNSTLPATVPGGVRYGALKVDMYTLPEGEPLDERLAPDTPIRLFVPAYLPFPDKCSVVLKAADQGRAAAIGAIQSMMLRFLTGLPPGKVRFTIIDPVGLGENFAAFMHLADYDEQLVGPRIWTEAGQIEKRLLDVTEHMENVIQKYLRNQYKSIEEYNRAAGEVAEPYRVLVIANFPTNFTPDAARRLVSILTSGPACGVCTLVSVDTKAAMPRDFRLADLEQAAFNLVWKDGKFALTDPVLAAYPLTLDPPPTNTDMATIVRKVGEASRDAAKVEVPFEFIMPKPDMIWKSSSAKSFDVPVGRSGATKKQMFMVGRGTAQHALVAGKTGSGKSTLLHALITNLALMYSPDEAELYLIDFKKGVEFRAYAANKLPHAKVVAIESEREFGLSVLQRLDVEIRERGDKFRAAGVNDLDGYRDYLKTQGKDGVMPRILFVVDEFQEFFVEDDKLAQEAALLLDRLVRQGRAFGLHLFLGSQTLGGAYSLARTTIDQMAVRIALQCSDADAQLILSKDNSAARLLSRPGEAIYNDANGLLEGNDPFQVVWLDEDHRDRLLKEIHARAGDRYPPPLVFEGNIPAELPKNPMLKAVLEKKPTDVKSPVVWLGDAVAIKDPTAAVFRAQSGANLLLIGSSEEAALAILTAAMVAFTAEVPTAENARTVTLLDGTPDDSEHAEYLRKAATALGYATASVERFEIQQALADLAAEIAKRLSGEVADRSARFVLVQGLQRFRELRKPDDDFGFGRKGDQPKSPGELFATILRDGPAVGVHVIVWCDSLTNLNRALDRQALKEFTQRVLFQMSSQDSSTLIDTPVASRLGRTRALFVQEELERPEKFRPYGLPELTWLRGIGENRPA